MKILRFSFISLLSVVLSGGIAFAAPTSNRNPVPEPAGTGIKLSTLRVGSTEDDPIRVFKLVRFTTQGANQAAVASGDALVYDTNSLDGVSVRYTTTSGDGAFAGIAVTTIGSADAGSTSAFDDIGHKNWGWICVHGPAVASVGGIMGSGAVAGDLFIASADAGKIAPLQSNGAGITTPDLFRSVRGRGGFFMETPTDSTSRKVFVQAQ